MTSNKFPVLRQCKTLAASIKRRLKTRIFRYICCMKTRQKKEIVKSSSREEILRSVVASFRIEGINISEEQALATLKKVEANLGK